MRKIYRRLNKYFRLDVYQRLFTYVKPYKLDMAIVTAAVLAQSGLNLLDPWPLKIIIDNGLTKHPFPAWLTERLPVLSRQSPLRIIFFAVILAVTLRVIANLLEVASEYVKSRVNYGMNRRFAADLFNHLLRLSFKYHDKTTVGDSLYRINNDTTFLGVLLWSNFRHLLTAAVLFIGMLWILLRLDLQLTLIAVAAAPLQYAAIGLYGHLFREKSKRIRGMESIALSDMNEALTCLRVVKSFSHEDRERRRVDDQRVRAMDARLKLDLQENLFSFGLRFMSRLSRNLILLIGAIHVLQGKLTIGSLLVILNYVNQLQEPIETVGEVLQNMQTSLVSAERVLEVLDVDPDVKERSHAAVVQRARGAIQFDHVSFGYDPSRPVLHDINLLAEPGEVVAVVGPTGAGKTTLVSLINRLYDAESGCVSLDGRDVRDLTLRSLRANVALVLQDPLLFSRTVRENIAYGRPDASDDDIVRAAKLARAHEFIANLECGYDTEVGNRGARLSGGERQRISIARAFLQDAPVLILDEPTSALDSRTEGGILDALDGLMIGRTTFIIAHRLSTVRHADQILVLDHGHIIERGAHDELVRLGGLYFHLHKLQTSGLRQRATSEAVS